MILKLLKSLYNKNKIKRMKYMLYNQTKKKNQNKYKIRNQKQKKIVQMNKIITIL